MEPSDTVRNIEHEMIDRLIDARLDVEHFLGINRRLVEHRTVVFIVRCNRLDFQVTVLGRCGHQIGYIAGRNVRMHNL